eukprot:GFKZ01005833.1.p1 GENE.GFKZ01005833.1~~GFKZ01005833.1.p1  ORF type:complete len:245 (-),score=34.15 GFKZ01005833.1:429-1085(-)
MANRQIPPTLLDRVDIYWPSCERYFRGTLVRAAPPAASTFFIFYDDNEYIRTNLNKVRWHYATKTCCKGEQDILLTDDFVVGDTQRCFGAKRKAPRNGNESAEKAPKRRRPKIIQDVGNKVVALANGVSNVTIEASEMRSELGSSNKIRGLVAEESNSVTNDWKQLGKAAEQGNNETVCRRQIETQEGTVGDEVRNAMDGREHWKKLMLAGYEKNRNA